MDVLSHGWQAAFYIVAVVLFAGAAFEVAVKHVNLVALGLAVGFAVPAWNSLALA